MKTTHTSRRGHGPLSTAALVLALGFAAMNVHAQTASAPSASSSMKPMASGAMAGHGSDQVHKTMMTGMDKMQQMKPSGDTDKDFAMMMRMHHQQAVDTAKVEIEHGKSAEMKAMARKMVKDQTKEIAQLDAWLKKHP
jgi:uncharacterized protein (DUF305 family)